MQLDVFFIDFQQGFCNPDLNELFVPGSVEDAKRAAAMVKRLGLKIDDIHLTLDSHHHVQISHSIWWKNVLTGQHPDPFTIITLKDLRDNIWTTTRPSLYARSFAYVEALEAVGRYPLCIWPYHCVIGTQGHNLVPVLADAVKEWELANFAVANYVTKGSGLFAEHYSVVKAEVPDPNDPSTQINTAFIETLQKSDMIIVGGEALSHCVRNSILDVLDCFNNSVYNSKIWICTDLTSSVPTFEAEGQKFLAEMSARGINLTTSTEILA